MFSDTDPQLPDGIEPNKVYFAVVDSTPNLINLNLLLLKVML